ncbi:STAS domain-containing protein [Mycolicibacterium sp. CR10]|uniref:STAS domain-containing protein n=1 Tax=Mycolicibacterium sp. CR10 TaxID=2562314 RepID=UPI001F0DA4AE|nr:STAS domain-containing protein [Mycolicibacterium sp. CR10]
MKTTSLYPSRTASSDESQRCGRATFALRHCSPTRIAVAVRGEVDAVNGRALGRYVERHTRVSQQLVLDLRAVDFSGTQAFNALFFISVYCARRDVDWAIVGSRPVQRLLRVCDPQGELPFDDGLGTALMRLDRLAQWRHALVWTGRSGWQPLRQRRARPPALTTHDSRVAKAYSHTSA